MRSESNFPSLTLCKSVLPTQYCPRYSPPPPSPPPLPTPVLHFPDSVQDGSRVIHCQHTHTRLSLIRIYGGILALRRARAHTHMTGSPGCGLLCWCDMTGSPGNDLLSSCGISVLSTGGAKVDHSLIRIEYIDTVANRPTSAISAAGRNGGSTEFPPPPPPREIEKAKGEKVNKQLTSVRCLVLVRSREDVFKFLSRLWMVHPGCHSSSFS